MISFAFYISCAQPHSRGVLYVASFALVMYVVGLVDRGIEVGMFGQMQSGLYLQPAVSMDVLQRTALQSLISLCPSYSSVDRSRLNGALLCLSAHDGALPLHCYLALRRAARQRQEISDAFLCGRFLGASGRAEPAVPSHCASQQRNSAGKRCVCDRRVWCLCYRVRVSRCHFHGLRFVVVK